MLYLFTKILSSKPIGWEWACPGESRPGRNRTEQERRVRVIWEWRLLRAVRRALWTHALANCTESICGKVKIHGGDKLRFCFSPIYPWTVGLCGTVWAQRAQVMPSFSALTSARLWANYPLWRVTMRPSPASLSPDSGCSTSRPSWFCRRILGSVTPGAPRCSWRGRGARSPLRTISCPLAVCSPLRSERGSLRRCCQCRAAALRWSLDRGGFFTGFWTGVSL